MNKQTKIDIEEKEKLQEKLKDVKDIFVVVRNNIGIKRFIALWYYDEFDNMYEAIDFNKSKAFSYWNSRAGCFDTEYYKDDIEDVVLKLGEYLFDYKHHFEIKGELY